LEQGFQIIRGLSIELFYQITWRETRAPGYASGQGHVGGPFKGPVGAIKFDGHLKGPYKKIEGLLTG
jgi:hypothetical protein